MAVPSLSHVKDRHYLGGGRAKWDDPVEVVGSFFSIILSVEFYGLIPQLIFSVIGLFLCRHLTSVFFGLGLYLQNLDQIIVWSFSWLFITLSLLDAVVNHPYQYLLSYFDTFLTWWSSFFRLFHPCELAPSASL